MSSTYSYRPPLGLDIRIKPTKKKKGTEKPTKRECAWPNCKSLGRHRAPKRDNAREFQWLCLDHVREFNRAWNFFEGMEDDDVKKYVEDSLTGHRPTWSMGTNGTASEQDGEQVGAGPSMKNKFEARLDPVDGKGDHYGLFSESAQRAAQKRMAPRLTRYQIRALETLDLSETATRSEIKTKYKKLVKKYHPDANGGDTAAVERLRSVIKAYNVLKTAKLAPDD